MQCKARQTCILANTNKPLVANLIKCVELLSATYRKCSFKIAEYRFFSEIAAPLSESSVSNEWGGEFEFSACVNTNLWTARTICSSLQKNALLLWCDRKFNHSPYRSWRMYFAKESYYMKRVEFSVKHIFYSVVCCFPAISYVNKFLSIKRKCLCPCNKCYTAAIQHNRLKFFYFSLSESFKLFNCIEKIE